jgi:two-component system, OmpR family, sensor histidine kinase KdpD
MGGWMPACPEGEYEKRWEDAGKLLDAGISVIIALSVQNLQSRNDAVEAVTFVGQPETVPDAVVLMRSGGVH